MTQRDAFWNKIYDLAKENKDIVIVTADMGAPSLDKFRTNLPGQFINVGIAEQNAILVATGLAMKGKHPFVYAIAPFITLRCLEQIRVNSAIMNIPITIVGVGAGFGYEDSGPTHHLTEDISVMRSMPNITIHSISDNVMAEKIAEQSSVMDSTNYIRLDRMPQETIYSEETELSKGFEVVKESSRGNYILATGFMVQTAIKASAALAGKGVETGVIDVYSIPLPNDDILAELKGAKSIITLEEHFLPAGFGSFILELANSNGLNTPIKRIGIDIKDDYCYEYGGRQVIHEFYGIDLNTVVEQSLSFLK